MNVVTKLFFVVIFTIANAFLFAEAAPRNCDGPEVKLPCKGGSNVNCKGTTCTINCNDGQTKTLNCPCGGISIGGGTVRCSKGPTFEKCFPFCNNNGGSNGGKDPTFEKCFPFCNNNGGSNG